MAKLLSQPLLLLVFCISSSYSQVRLTAVDPITQNITIKNFGNSDVDISGYRLCSHLDYTIDLQSDATVSLVSGNLVLSQDEEVTVNWATSNGLDIDGRDLGLYLPGAPFAGFDDPAQMVDFVQYLGSYAVPDGRENVAVAKGIWVTGTYVNANGPYTYIGNGNDYGFGFWTGSSPACVINGLTPGNQTSCDPGTNTYTQEVIVTYANEPVTGTIDVNGQSFAITGSPQTVTLNGLIADGQPVDVTAGFSDDPGCIFMADDLFTAPSECTFCSITDLTAGVQTGCDPFTNTYTQEVTVFYQNEPATGTLEVNGQFFAITSSPQLITLTGLVSDGREVAVTARFTADTLCVYTEGNLFTAPPECANSCNILALFAGAQTPCDTSNNTYTQEVMVAYINEPLTGTLEVNGQSFPITGSPQTVTLQGLQSDGASQDVTASFSEEPMCTFVENDLFIAPEECKANDPPEALDDAVSTVINTSVIIDILINDSDPDGNIDPASVQIMDLPRYGEASVNADGTLNYTPAQDFIGSDTLSYQVADDLGALSNKAVVVITVDALTSLGTADPSPQDEVQFTAYQNTLYIQLKNKQTYKLYAVLTDLWGRVLQEKQLISQKGGEFIFPVAARFASQLLMVSIATNEGKRTRKIILQAR